MTKRIFLLLGIIGWLVLFAACNNDDEGLPTTVPVSTLPDGAADTAVSSETNNLGAANTPVATPTDTAVPPTPTPSEPLAALVNDQPLFLADYEKELARYEQAAADSDTPLEDGYRTAVLDALIEQLLIEQTANSQGVVVTPEMVDQEMTSLRAEGDFDAWLEANLYTEEEFREAVHKGMLTEAAIAQVTAAVPQAVEQVHARYIHVADQTQASDLLSRLRAGDDFATLADQFSLEPGNGGDMGWFALGSLFVPELEAPTFALQNPGDLTEIIPVTGADGTTTYYILQLVERDEARPLTAEMRSQLLQAALTDWLATLWDNAEVVRLVDTGS